MPSKNENRTINIYGTTVATAVTPYVYLYKGKFVFDKTASGTAGIAVWDDAPAEAGLGAEHQLTIVAVPDATNTIGYEITIPDEVAIGRYDLVFLNGLVYKTGIRIEVKADKTVIDVTNRDGK